ncbi:hypothetical protein COY95_04250, partial [Candidatus Woesearchaeota archaeon CG_4_10_14_0_8_um_filter_47_5]
KNNERLAVVCPVNIFKKTKEGKVELVEKNIPDCTLCMACVDEEPEGVKVYKNSSDIMVFIESWGQLDPEVMVTKGVELLTGKCDGFEKSLKA